METFKVVPTFESADEILWFDHSNEPLQQYFRMVLWYYGLKR